jgi:hypothetical protein
MIQNSDAIWMYQYYICKSIHTFTSEHKDYRYDVSNTFTILFYYRHFLLS